jgi:hypothetical protein
VGSQGYEEENGPLIGSVGERVVRIAPPSVIVVKPQLAALRRAVA